MGPRPASPSSGVYLFPLAFQFPSCGGGSGGGGVGVDGGYCTVDVTDSLGTEVAPAVNLFLRYLSL